MHLDVPVSLDHDFIVELFRTRPMLAPELLRRCVGRDVAGRAELGSIDLSQVVPIEYRADVFVVIRDNDNVATHAIVVEVQTTFDKDKEYTWPVYLTVARARLRCPITLLVIAPELAIARRVAEPILLGGGFTFIPCVIALDDIPTSVDEETAHQLPELLLLVTLAHPTAELVEATYHEIRTLPETATKLYFDRLLDTLPDALRRLL